MKKEIDYIKIKGIIGLLIIVVSLLYGKYYANEIFPFYERLIAGGIMIIGIAVGWILSNKYLSRLFPNG